MAVPIHIGLVSEIADISASDLTNVAAALQMQVTRDFGPLWNIQATVDAFTSLDDLPLDAWPIVIEQDINEPGAAGFHTDENGQPYALVQFDDGWSLTVSHECLEMLVDPSGNLLAPGPSLKSGQGRVQYLVEVCDPCEDTEFAYTINGILVSDFVTPQFFYTVHSQASQYDLRGAITAPHQVLQNGYISWMVPRTKQWWQEQYFEGSQTIQQLGSMEGKMRENLRATIDALTPNPAVRRSLKGNKHYEAARAAFGEARDARVARAEALRTHIRSFKGKKK
jgi:hypothetical protein